LHLVSEAKIPKKEYIEEFFNKLSFKMQPLIAVYKTVKTFKEFEVICNSVAPALSKVQGARRKQNEFGKKASAAGLANPGMPALLTKILRGQISEDRDKLIKEGRCFYCKEAGYIKP
jgi:hypothetical protein